MKSEKNHSRRCPFCGSLPKWSLSKRQDGRAECTIGCPGCGVTVDEINAKDGRSALHFAKDNWRFWCDRMEKAKEAGLDSIRGRTCEGCRWFISTNCMGWSRCTPCEGTGILIKCSPVCGLFVPKDAETGRNGCGLEPCLCGCTDIGVKAHWSGCGMGESCDLKIKCPQCGIGMDADDFGVGWNSMMMKMNRKVME